MSSNIYNKNNKQFKKNNFWYDLWVSIKSWYYQKPVKIIPEKKRNLLITTKSDYNLNFLPTYNEIKSEWFLVFKNPFSKINFFYFDFFNFQWFKSISITPYAHYILTYTPIILILMWLIFSCMLSFISLERTRIVCLILLFFFTFLYFFISFYIYSTIPKIESLNYLSLNNVIFNKNFNIQTPYHASLITPEFLNNNKENFIDYILKTDYDIPIVQKKIKKKLHLISELNPINLLLNSKFSNLKLISSNLLCETKLLFSTKIIYQYHYNYQLFNNIFEIYVMDLNKTHKYPQVTSEYFKNSKISDRIKNNQIIRTWYTNLNLCSIYSREIILVFICGFLWSIIINIISSIGIVFKTNAKRMLLFTTLKNKIKLKKKKKLYWKLFYKEIYWIHGGMGAMEFTSLERLPKQKKIKLFQLKFNNLYLILKQLFKSIYTRISITLMWLCCIASLGLTPFNNPATIIFVIFIFIVIILIKNNYIFFIYYYKNYNFYNNFSLLYQFICYYYNHTIILKLPNNSINMLKFKPYFFVNNIFNNLTTLKIIHYYTNQKSQLIYTYTSFLIMCWIYIFSLFKLKIILISCDIAVLSIFSILNSFVIIFLLKKLIKKLKIKYHKNNFLNFLNNILNKLLITISISFIILFILQNIYILENYFLIKYLYQIKYITIYTILFYFFCIFCYYMLNRYNNNDFFIIKILNILEILINLSLIFSLIFIFIFSFNNVNKDWFLYIILFILCFIINFYYISVNYVENILKKNKSMLKNWIIFYALLFLFLENIILIYYFNFINIIYFFFLCIYVLIIYFYFIAPNDYSTFKPILIFLPCIFFSFLILYTMKGVKLQIPGYFYISKYQYKEGYILILWLWSFLFTWRLIKYSKKIEILSIFVLIIYPLILNIAFYWKHLFIFSKYDYLYLFIFIVEIFFIYIYIIQLKINFNILCKPYIQINLLTIKSIKVIIFLLTVLFYLLIGYLNLNNLFISKWIDIVLIVLVNIQFILITFCINILTNNIRSGSIQDLQGGLLGYRFLKKIYYFFYFIIFLIICLFLINFI